MEGGGRSQTAETCAAIRAMHFLHGERPLVFEDPVAIELIGPDWRERCLHGEELGRSGAAGVVLGRSRYAEDQLEAAVRSGVNQYVLLGAGLDSFALRRPDLLATIRAYEIDLPATQAWKRECLARLGRELPAALEFVPVDFEHETIGEALRRSSYRSAQRAFFSWLGTTMFLSHEAILRTLESLGAVSTAGSGIVFDYRVSIEFADPTDIHSIEGSARGTAQMGEPQISWLNPLTFPNEVCALGFDVIENLSPKQLQERYFAGRSDVLRPLSHHYYAHFQRRH